MASAGRLFVQLHPTSSGFYMPGQVVSGAVVLNRHKRLSTQSSSNLSSELYIEVVGRGKVHWSNDKSIHRAAESYLLLKIPLTLNIPNQSQVSWLPFNFTLPFDIPSSYESDYGNVRYTIKAVLKRNQLLKRNFVNKTRIVVTRLPEPITQQSVNQHQFVTRQYGYWPKSNEHVLQKWIKVDAWIDKSFYLAGETIRFNAKIENCGSESIRKTKIQFTQYTTYTDGKDTFKVKKVLWEQKGLKIHPRHSQVWDNIPITISSSAPQTGLPFCQLINIFYVIKIFINPGLFYPDLLNRIDVSIGNSVSLPNTNPSVISKLINQPHQPVAPSSSISSDLDSFDWSEDTPPPTYEECANSIHPIDLNGRE